MTGVERLRQLIEDAATLPWYAQWEGQSYHVRGHNGSVDDFPISDGAYAINTQPQERYERERAECDTSDADLMVAAVNALPLLLDVADAARKFVAGEPDCLYEVAGGPELRQAVKAFDKAVDSAGDNRSAPAHAVEAEGQPTPKSSQPSEDGRSLAVHATFHTD